MDDDTCQVFYASWCCRPQCNAKMYSIMLLLLLFWLVLLKQQQRSRSKSRKVEAHLERVEQPSASEFDQILPPEIIEYIISYLNISSVIRCRAVSKYWRSFNSNSKFDKALALDFRKESRSQFLDQLQKSSPGFTFDSYWADCLDNVTPMQLTFQITDAAETQKRRKYLLEIKPEGLPRLVWHFRSRNIDEGWNRFLVKTTANILSNHEWSFAIDSLFLECHPHEFLQWKHPRDERGQCRVIFNLYDVLNRRPAERVPVTHFRVFNPLEWTYELFPNRQPDLWMTFLTFLTPFPFQWAMWIVPKWFIIQILSYAYAPIFYALFLAGVRPTKNSGRPFLTLAWMLCNLIITIVFFNDYYQSFTANSGHILMLYLPGRLIHKFLHRKSMTANRRTKTIILLAIIAILSLDWTNILTVYSNGECFGRIFRLLTDFITLATHRLIIEVILPNDRDVLTRFKDATREFVRFAKYWPAPIFVALFQMSTNQ